VAEPVEENGNGSGKTRKKSGKSNIYDVAEKAGVSFVTVSRVFNDHPNVSDNMRDRVFAAARDVGYSPKLVSRPRVIGILLGDLTKMSGRSDKSALCGQISRAAAQREFMVQYIPFKQIEVATKRLVDGVIEVDLGEEQLKHLEKIPNVPVVLTHNRTLNEKWSSVTVDYYEEGRLASATLTDQGHRKIAVVLDQRSGWFAEERVAGILDHLSPLGIHLDTESIFELSSHHPEDIARAIKAGGFTAVISLASDSTPHMVDALFNVIGFKIPEELSVLVLDNSPFSRHYHPRLSSVEQPIALIAEKAVDELIRLMDHEGESRHIQLRSQLQLRDTCLPLASPPA